MHKKITMSMGIGHKNSINNITDNNETILYTEDKLEVWKRYIGQLFDDVRTQLWP